jgi:membrane protease YdiL (CAAX protease family)
MISLFWNELQEIYSFFKNNYKETVILCAATLFLVLVSTQPIRLSLVINYLIYFAILPVLTILIILRKNPLDYGLRIGNYKLWGLYIALTVIIGIPILYVGAHFSSISHYYTRRFDYYSFLTQMVPLLFAWEYLLRGFLLFGLKEKFKEGSILIQMVPFTLLHLGKPEIEILLCIPMGIWFGYVAYRSKSFWPAFIIHVFINFTLKYFVNY